MIKTDVEKTKNEIDFDNFEESLSKISKLVLADFKAAWCGPCKMLSPVLEQVKDERDDVEVIKIDIDEHGGLASRYGIMSVPTMIYFWQGEEIQRVSGYMPKERIIDTINALKSKLAVNDQV